MLRRQKDVRNSSIAGSIKGRKMPYLYNDIRALDANRDQRDPDEIDQEVYDGRLQVKIVKDRKIAMVRRKRTSPLQERINNDYAGSRRCNIPRSRHTQENH
jgi:hypothetical protein